MTCISVFWEIKQTKTCVQAEKHAFFPVKLSTFLQRLRGIYVISPEIWLIVMRDASSHVDWHSLFVVEECRIWIFAFGITKSRQFVSFRFDERVLQVRWPDGVSGRPLKQILRLNMLLIIIIRKGVQWPSKYLRACFALNREVKIARFRVRVRVGLPVPVLGYTENQSNLRYIGWHQVWSEARWWLRR